jgi:hypothetical protein
MMKDTSSLNSFPKRQIKPYDGMAITADVWTEAHEEHRQTERAHNHFLHGSGIITGFEILANDPPDNYIFISPGIALDTVGNVIELTETKAYDFGNTAEGTLYLLLGHGEREVGGVNKDIRYCQNEVVIAARSTIPKRASVELARITISEKGEPIKNAENPSHPGVDELDLRYRKPIGPGKKKAVRVAICELGQDNASGSPGWDFLNRECERSTPYKLILDRNDSISEALLDYKIVFLKGIEPFQLSESDVQVLDQYLDLDKKLIIEAQDESSQASFEELLEKLNRELQPIEASSSLLIEPFLFNSPPEGLNGNLVLADSQVIYTNAGFSSTWAGKAGDTQLSRSDIRSAHEWGLNMIFYCLKE